jgi:hypothetical protein
VKGSGLKSGSALSDARAQWNSPAALAEQFGVLLVHPEEFAGQLRCLEGNAIQRVLEICHGCGFDLDLFGQRIFI